MSTAMREKAMGIHERQAPDDTNWGDGFWEEGRNIKKIIKPQASEGRHLKNIEGSIIE
jgi:hypothetical protein